MADPLTIAGSVVGVVSLGIQVTQSLVDFYRSYKHMYSDLEGTVGRLESLTETFQLLEKTISTRKFDANEQNVIRSAEKAIACCEELIQELKEECEKFTKSCSSHGIKTAIKVAGRRATYSFRQSTLQKLDEDVNEIRTNLSSALSVLHLKDSQRIQDDLAEIKQLVDLVRSTQISSNLRDWLKAPDATIDHNAACSKKHPGTGAWLIKDARFESWRSDENSLLWLNGFAGSGKSVLCSTAIQSVLRYRASDPRIGIAFFYFTFNDESKRDLSAMLRTLFLQLSTQSQDGCADLTQMYESCKSNAPSTGMLTEYLRRLIERFEHVYIILDALDESPRDGPRGSILDAIEVMRSWGTQGLHLLVTSRDERDIRECLNIATVTKIQMKNLGIDNDIINFISGQFDTSRRLRKWLPYRDRIQTTLAERAKGVFRWVECQFTSLERCACSEAHLDHLLSSLPVSLDNTYERILCSIEPTLVRDARRILTLLCFASQPLTIPELIDGIAVEIDKESLMMNRKRRLRDAHDILEICPGLVDIDHNLELNLEYSVDSSNKPALTAIETEKSTARIAHYSVQEYLESERIRTQKAQIFALNSTKAHSEITLICLGYLLDPDFSSSILDEDMLREYPLATFAAEAWFEHYKSSADLGAGLNKYVVEFCKRENSFLNWVRLWNVDKDRRSLNRTSESIAGPVYYLSILGFHLALIDFLEIKNTQALERRNPQVMLSPPSGELLRTAKAREGTWSNPLGAASRFGHEEVVQVLLDHGADTSAQGGDVDETALQLASEHGHVKVVQLLLDAGAEISARGEYVDETALQLASKNGHVEVVQLLLDHGAEINARVGRIDETALQLASGSGHMEVVQLLLDHGAEINTRGNRGDETALQSASKRDQVEVVQLLLDRGAEINALGGTNDTALQTASSFGHEKVVQLLLDRGADINAQGREGTALQAASYRGTEKIMQLLLDRGAEVNARGGCHGNALQAAARCKNEKLVQLLLDRGADINAQGGGEYGTALQLAINYGFEKVVQLLLDRGADTNAQGGEYGTAIQAASASGREEWVQLLLDRGADVNAQGGKYDTALQAASSRGEEKTAKLLLDRGADVNAQGGEYGTAIQAASWRGDEGIAKLLLDHGADVNILGGRYGSALAAAEEYGHTHERVAQLLVLHGATRGATQRRPLWRNRF